MSHRLTNPFRTDPHPDLSRTIAEIVAPKSKKPKGKTPVLPDKWGGREPYVKNDRNPHTAPHKPVSESHARKQLEGLPISRLRDLKKKYGGQVLKGNRDAARELADIRGLLRAKGAGVVVDEGRKGASPCEQSALDAVRRANAADLKEYPGGRGERAHARLHTTIGKILKK